MANNPSFFTASGNISPSRIVKQAATDYTVTQASGITDRLFGISDKGTKMPPGVSGADGYAARAGESLRVYGDGEVCQLEAGAAITNGDLLTTDSSGRGITIVFTSSGSALLYKIAVALEDASGVGVLIKVQVERDVYYGFTA